ncbi:acyl-CoA dehydrogenase [candidate division KSB1 bacterium]|nr:acyl-CoA dehydrogenase [candidate division KSB1 bacterium]
MILELTEEQQMIRDVIREFCEKEIAPIAARIDVEMSFPEETIKKMGELGFMGIPFPEEYGGAGMDTVSYSLVIEELAKVCASHCITCSAHTSLATNPIYEFGTEDQKKKYLPKMTSGEFLGSFCLTEPGSGSDVKSMKTFAKKNNDGYVLNGSKAFITNAGYADIFIVFAITDVSENGSGMTTFIVEKDTPGLTVATKEAKLGWRASDTRQIHFDNMFVPDENVLGEVGNGFVQAMATLDGGRISIAAMSLGIAEGAFKAALKYSKERKQFDRPISDFQSVQIMLADMATEIAAAKLMTYYAAELKDNGKPFSQAATIAKLYSSEAGTRIAYNGIQIHGGYGYSMEYPAERYYRDAKGCEIGEGTSEIQRILLARQLIKE